MGHVEARSGIARANPVWQLLIELFGLKCHKL